MSAKLSGLRLIAEDSDDLDVISAHLQDAVTLVRDIAYLPSARRFAMVVNRFRWEGVGAARSHGLSRVRAGLHFDNVLKVQTRYIAQDRPEGVVNLLAIRFAELEAPSGIVTLSFSGGAEIRLEVEALEAHLKDMSLTWETTNLPDHGIDE